MSNEVAPARRGRPTVEGSKRQAVLAMRAAKVAAGGEIKRGRPAGTKKDVEPKAKAVKKAKLAVVDLSPETEPVAVVEVTTKRKAVKPAVVNQYAEANAAKTQLV